MRNYNTKKQTNKQIFLILLMVLLVDQSADSQIQLKVCGGKERNSEEREHYAVIKRTERLFSRLLSVSFFFTSRGRDAQRGYTLKEGHSFEGLVSMAGVALVSGKGLDGPSGAIGPCQQFKSIERVQVGGYM